MRRLLAFVTGRKRPIAAPSTTDSCRKIANSSDSNGSSRDAVKLLWFVGAGRAVGLAPNTEQYWRIYSWQFAFNVDKRQTV